MSLPCSSAFLSLARERIDYGTAAARLSVSEGAARVAVHRLRRRFRELYREEISQTLPDGADLEAELAPLGGSPGPRLKPCRRVTTRPPTGK